jgi:hypothetical protein
MMHVSLDPPADSVKTVQYRLSPSIMSATVHRETPDLVCAVGKVYPKLPYHAALAWIPSISPGNSYEY